MSVRGPAAIQAGHPRTDRGAESCRACGSFHGQDRIMTRRALSRHASDREVAVSDKELFDAVVRQIGIFLETDVSHLRPDSHLARDLDGLSSLKLFELMLYLEDSV